MSRVPCRQREGGISEVWAEVEPRRLHSRVKRSGDRLGVPLGTASAVQFVAFGGAIAVNEIRFGCFCKCLAVWCG
jgi:hypothetical protein